MPQTTASHTVGQTGIGQKAAAYVHPVYTTFIPVWTKLLHVREGTGGFLDGTYLVAHPREWQDHTAEVPRVPTKKLKARRALARYENIAATLIVAKKAALFREPPSRRVGKQTDKTGDAPPSPIEAWWKNVDGQGTPIDDWLEMAWDAAATFGHVAIFMDRPKTAPVAEGATTTAADAPLPFLRAYVPIDILDWLTDENGNLTGLKFQEAVPRETFAETTKTTDYQLRTVDRESWAVYSKNGKLQDGGATGGQHQLGALPVVILYAQRRPLIPNIGQSVLFDPQNFIDLYNLTSEVRELLRNQTFSWINIPLGTGDQAMGIEDAKTMLGEIVGTNNVLFSGMAAGILSADAENVIVYHAEITRLLRLIYRLAALQWESDSKDAEAEGSLKLKREDMNQRLTMYAGELQKADTAIAQLFYRAHYGADAGPVAFEQPDTHPVIEYPDTFDTTPFKEVLEQAQSAMSLGMPALVLKAIRKALLVKFLPNATPEEIQELEKAIDAAEDDLTPAQMLREKIAAQAGAFGGKQDDDDPEKKKPAPKKDDKAA